MKNSLRPIFSDIPNIDKIFPKNSEEFGYKQYTRISYFRKYKIN